MFVVGGGDGVGEWRQRRRRRTTSLQPLQRRLYSDVDCIFGYLLKEQPQRQQQQQRRRKTRRLKV